MVISLLGASCFFFCAPPQVTGKKLVAAVHVVGHVGPVLSVPHSKRPLKSQELPYHLKHGNRFSSPQLYKTF